MTPIQPNNLAGYHTLAALLAILFIAFMCFVIYFMVRMLKASKARRKNQHIYDSLADVLKAQRGNAKMTQEFVAEAVGVSRQAVSKWESGKAEPSTSNLIALAKLYGLSPTELLKQIENKEIEE